MSVNPENIRIFDTLDSTNNYAMGMVRTGLWTHGDACFSFEQTEGKGTRGKQWLSNKGDNIILSLVVDTSNLPIKDHFYLSVTVALACREFFAHYAGEPTKIKWPNDIYWNDRKAAGILIENVIRGDIWQHSIVGVGMNINQVIFDMGAQHPISLKQITGNSYLVLDLVKQLYLDIFSKLEMLKAGKYKLLISDYNQHLFKLHQKVKLKTNRGIIECIIEGVTDFGTLIAATPLQMEFSYGEVQWLIDQSRI